MIKQNFLKLLKVKNNFNDRLCLLRITKFQIQFVTNCIWNFVIRRRQRPLVSVVVECLVVCGKQLACLIDQILDFCKIEENKMVIEHNPISLSDVVSDAVRVVYFGGATAENKLELICDYDPSTNFRFCSYSPKMFPT